MTKASSRSSPEQGRMLRVLRRPQVKAGMAACRAANVVVLRLVD